MTAYIYRAIGTVNKKHASAMHDEGITNVGYKKFNYFTYVLSQGTSLVKKKLKKGKADLVISSCIENTIIYFTEGMMKIGNIQIFGKGYKITNIEYMEDSTVKNAEIFNILSPVYVEGPGRKWLDKKELEERAADLLVRKYFALHNKLPEKDTKVKLLNASQEYMYYKNDIYRGYKGDVIVEGDKDMVKLAYNGGLGAKCGCGMGLLEKV